MKNVCFHRAANILGCRTRRPIRDQRLTAVMACPRNNCASESLAIRSFTTNPSNNPYLILGVPPSSSFQTVQKAFVKLAFQHHPDTSMNSATISKDFIRIREAFERIRDARQSGKPLSMVEEAETGYNNTASNNKSWTENDFLVYFYRQTGVKLTSDQREELVHLYRNRVQGGYAHYSGHSWDLARRLVVEQEAFLRNMHGGGPRKRGQHTGPPPFQAGPEGEEANSLRRRRKR